MFKYNLSEFFDTPHFGFGFDWENYTTTEVEEFDDKFEAYIALPGVKKKDINLTVKNNLLTLETKQNKDYKINTEFKKVWKLGDSIDVGKITVSLSSGILTIILPKKEEDKPITLTVK